MTTKKKIITFFTAIKSHVPFFELGLERFNATYKLNLKNMISGAKLHKNADNFKRGHFRT